MAIITGIAAIGALALVLQYGQLAAEDPAPPAAVTESTETSRAATPSPDVDTAQAGWLTVETGDLDLGRVTQDRNITHVLKVSNAGSAPVTIAEIKSS